MTDFKERITSSDVLTFDPEESLLRGQIPLKEFGDILKNQDETKVIKISFSRNGYCNDAVLKLIQSYKKKDYENLSEVKLDGCFLITNAGIKWLSDVIQGAKNLKKITLDGCTDLTDNELYLIARTMGPVCEIDMRGTSLRYITDIERNRVKITGCPVLSTDSIVDMKDSHAVIVPHDSIENSLAYLIMEKKTLKRQTFHHLTDFKTDGNWNFTLTELSLTQPLFDVVVSRNLSQVIIPFNGAADTQDVKKHVTDTVLKILSKTPFVGSYRKTKQQLEETSNPSYHYGTAHLKLMPLVYLRDIKKQMVPIVDSDGNEKGQLECCILLEEQDQSLTEEEKSKQAIKLVGQELKLKVKINFGKGLSPDLQSSYCRFKFFHVVNFFISTSEIVGSSPYYNFDRDFVIRSVRQKVIKYFEQSSLIIEVWGRDRKDGKMSSDSQGTSMAEPQSVYKGCEFIILETGNKPEGLDRVRIKADDFSSTLKQINDCIVQHEQNLQYLDVHDQKVYSSLYEMKEKIEEFCGHIDTIHYMSTDVTSIQGSKILVNKMIDIMENNKYHQEIKYCIPQKNKRILNIVLDIIKTDKIVEFGSGVFSSDERNLKIPGLEIFELAKTLHEQGKIGVIAIGSKTVFADIQFLEAMLLKLTEKSNMQSCKQLSTSIGDLTQVWTSDIAESYFLGKNQEKSPTDLIMEILKQYLGLIQMPAWRLQTTDPQYLYTVTAAMSAPSLPVNDFWKKEEKGKNIIIMKKVYRVLHSASDTLLAGILSSGTEYGRTILLSADGAVFQIGCVQTAVIKESDNDEKLQISVESRCYFPDVKSGPINADTEMYTNEYTWNIFCLYTDIIDKILKQSLVVYTLWSDIPQEFVNVSVGCSHSWGPNYVRPRQTVCTLCNKCTEQGKKCQYNGIIGDYLRECLCKTNISGCASCGICVQCVERLWDIRSYLRPLAACPNIGEHENKQAEKNDLEPEEDQKIELVENPFEELAMNAEILNEGIEVQSHEKTVDFIQSELDPIANNEFEVQHIADGILGIVLKEIDTGTIISVYPGKATAMIMDEDLKESEMAQNILRLSSNMEGYKYKFYPGDCMKVRITDPFRALQRDKSTTEFISQESKVVYHTAMCTKAMISHETGILCYHAPSPHERSSHKAYFIGSRPFSENFKSFSMKILKTGELKYIGIGVSADRSFQLSERPGRELRQANFIKYYINKGGIYNTGKAIVQKDGSNIGDVISINCDVTTNKLKFLRNDVVFYEVAFKMPEGGYYPQISMNSEGECVQLMEKNPWMTDSERVRDLKKPTAFDIYKYSDIWISPGKTLMMTMKRIKKPARTVRQLNGWIILHNPTDELVLYMLQPNNYVKQAEGCLKPGESLPIPVSQQLQHHGPSPLETGIKIVWLKVAENKPYSTEEVLQMFEKANKNDIGQHRLNCAGESSYSGDTETLPLFNEFQPSLEEIYKLEVYKNCELVNSYCLRKGKYMVDVYNLVQGKTAKYILKRPKCPSFLYPASVRRGMKVIIKLDSDKDEFAEAVVIGKVDRGYSLEYTPYDKDSTKVKWFCKDTCVGIDDLDWQNRTDVMSMKDFIKYSKSADSTLLYKTYIPAPPYLTTKGSAFMLNSINPKWQTDTLKLFSSCKQSNTRPTIQEQAITVSSRTLLKWLKFPRTSHSSVFLPSALDDMTLKYPKVTTMFSDVKINRLCCVHEKFFDQKLKDKAEFDKEMIDKKFGIKKWKFPRIKSLYSNTRKNFISIEDGLKEKTYKLKKPQEICLHFMDIPGFPVKQFVPVDLSYGCLYQSWTYVALLAYQLSVPAFDQLISTKGLERKQIESLLYQLIQPYASLCCIYSTQYGGLSYQHSPADYTDGIDDLYMESQLEPSVIDNQSSDNMLEDTNKFKRVFNFLACKAHSNGMFAQNLFTMLTEFTLEKQFYYPYSENLSTLLVNGVSLNTLPDNVFQTFRKLKVFAITDVPMAKTPIFPSGISQCSNLEIVCLSSMHGLKELPSDVILGPALRVFHIYNIPIRKLDIDWPVSSLLTSLTLTGLLIEEVPVKISNLHRLEELILDYNPITSIPEEIGRLEKLKILSMKGIPWIHLQQKSEMPKAMYQAWHEDNAFIRNYFNQEKVEELFSKFDLNNNNILDQHELARLNMYLLLNIPRIGLKSLGDKEYGGIPPAIFRLKSLEKLNLSYTAITMVPYQAKHLLKLTSLNLEHCPLLEGISGDVGLLPNLKSIYLNNCPSLETPPQDIVGRGVDSVKAFLKRIAGGFIECHRTKLMFIGLGQAGKTTLLQALRSEKKKTEKTEDVELTDGIDIIPWIVPVEHEGRKIDITYSCWDFAGQTVYYNTHQFFLSKQAVYVLLWNMRMGFEHAGLDFWLSSVACHCPDAPVIIVGTQLDQIPMPDMPEAELMEKYPQIKKFCYVSSTAGTNIAELEQTLTDVTMHHCSQMTMKIPKVWLSFENGILKERNEGRNIMEWKLLRKCAIDNGIYDDSDIRLAVDFLNDLGTVQHFDTEFLRDRVVINPQWIVDVMAKVVSVNEKSIKENLGRFYHSYIPEIWKDYDRSLHKWMLKLTETFDLTFPLPGEKEKYNIVPCLLPETKPLNLPWPYLSEEEEIREKTILYKFAYLPSGLFNRAQARLFSQGFTDHDLLQFLWKKGSILKKNQHYALVRQLNDYEMIVSVQGPRPKNVLDLIHETLTTLISEAFDGVHYDYFIQCPDCVEIEGTKEPFLFKAELISRAYSVNAPFLQCTKFFHTVSIGELLRIMPDNKETEFDAQMQESISTLQEISRNIAQDVAILYCNGDVPSLPFNSNTTPETAAGMTVDPRCIHEDLKKTGYKCWFPEDIDNISDMEMTMALKNSKVLVACMSERFVNHEKCHRWFLYAIEQLHKPFAIAVMNESLEWKHTDIGFKIGNPRMAMIKNMKRYPDKIKDLIDIIKGHMDNIEKMKLRTPEVFISYCWANSQEACSITTEAKDGSIGYGDPRVMKTHLEKNGIRCWMDIEQMGKYGLYQDITVGLQNSRVLVICVSDEYLESDACMMEARFGVHNLYLPIVVCIVGTGKLWKESEVSLMIKKQPELSTIIKMQKETPDVYDKVLIAVKNYLLQPETERQKKVREKLEKAKTKLKKKGNLEEKVKQQGDTNLSFQEEVELVQRKFMRYVTKLSMMEDTYIPRLLVVDLHDKKHSTNSLMDNLQYGNPEYIEMLLKAIDEAYTGNKTKAKEEIEKILLTITAIEIGNEENLPSELKWAFKLVYSKSEKSDEKFQKQKVLERNTSKENLLERELSLQKEEQDLEIKIEQKQKEQFKVQHILRILSNISAILEDCIDDEWKERNLNLRVLCEYEQGWHFYGITVDLDKLTGKENLMKVLKDISPYLSRFYAILKQSGVDLHCMESLRGENFLKFIQKEGTSTKNFTEAYRALRKVIEDYSDLDKSWLNEFWRCCLPNGKIAYLCKDHMSKVGATKIRDGTRRVLHVLTDQDKHFKDVLSENPVILQLKQEGITMKNDVKKEIEPKALDNSHGKNAEDQSVTSENNDSRLIQSRESSAQSDTSQQSSSSKRSHKSQRRTSQACSLQ
ncbi:uncharacterized protein LOC127729717 [Mytilus californianus]|uniref:uncharacterized protein LOC127729717 n=1 Tax=Mytilus californianus TaxID=6549 RepID=UPI0022477EDC|nr:uncharacterized protein LOC127729717 [Mytilus californianus]